jgi:hypothetical protein
MGDSYFVPFVATAAVFIILFSLLVLSRVNISEALFNPTFLRRTADIDERRVCRRLKINPLAVEEGRRVCSNARLLLITTTDNLARDRAQITQHLTLLSGLFHSISLVIVTPTRGDFRHVLPNVTVEVKVVESEYGGCSPESFQLYRRHWEERYSLFHQNSCDYLLVLDMDKPGRIFKRGILESFAYIERRDIAIGFRTVTPRGRFSETSPWYMPETLPYGGGMVKNDQWVMGIRKLPLKECEKYINTNMIYLWGEK